MNAGTLVKTKEAAVDCPDESVAAILGACLRSLGFKVTEGKISEATLAVWAATETPPRIIFVGVAGDETAVSQRLMAIQKIIWPFPMTFIKLVPIVTSGEERAIANKARINTLFVWEISAEKISAILNQRR